jgi:hypothetical protein
MAFISAGKGRRIEDHNSGCYKEQMNFSHRKFLGGPAEPILGNAVFALWAVPSPPRPSDYKAQPWRLGLSFNKRPL